MSSLEERIEARMKGRTRSKTPVNSPESLKRRRSLTHGEPARTSPRRQQSSPPLLAWEKTPTKITLVPSPGRNRRKRPVTPRTRSRSRSGSPKKKAKPGKSKSSKKSTPKMWKHALTLAFLFALCGGFIAFITPATPPADDPYTVLELHKRDMLNLPVQERRMAFKKAYRTLSKIHHPDRPQGSNEMFVLLSQSYEKLESTLESPEGYVPDSSEQEANEELEKRLKEAQKIIQSLVNNKLLRCVLIGGALGLVVGSMMSDRKQQSQQ